MTDTDQSWDAFWASVSKGPTEVIRGVEVAVPTDMPLSMEQRLTELQNSAREEDLRELVGLLFGADVLGEWVDASMGVLEFQTVLAWGLAAAAGQPVTFAEALQLAKDANAAGKATAGPNRAARRSQSAGGGGRSKPTSRANTASTRKTSRA